MLNTYNFFCLVGRFYCGLKPITTALLSSVTINIRWTDPFGDAKLYTRTMGLTTLLGGFFEAVDYWCIDDDTQPMTYETVLVGTGTYQLFSP